MVYTPVSAVANLRRSVLISAVLGAGAIAVCSSVGHPLMGIFALVGLMLGGANNWLLQRAVIRRAQGGVSNKRFSGGVFGRLGGITLVAIGMAILIHPDGLGIFVGLAVFQILMLVGAAVPVLRSLRPQA